MKTIISIILLFTSLSITAQKDIIKLKDFSISIPEGMKKVPANDVLLKLALGNSMYITIDDNMEKMMARSKNSPIGKELGMLNIAFDLKFDGIKNEYKGFNPSDKKEGTFKNFKCIAQKFTCKATKTKNAYLEYRVMVIGGNHYEFILTGLKESEEEQKKLIKSFWNSIVENKSKN